MRGGAPCSRETEILALTRGVAPRLVHGVVLAGGSVFGLAACDGVVRWLSERGIGLQTGHACIPIVPALGLYDLGVGDPRRGRTRRPATRPAPTPARTPPGEGRIGAGTGASVGKAAGMERSSRGGLGIARRALAGGGSVEAIVAVNAFGEVVDPANGRIVAGVRAARGRGFEPIDRILAGAGATPFGNTTIGVVVTDATLTREDADRSRRPGARRPGAHHPPRAHARRRRRAHRARHRPAPGADVDDRPHRPATRRRRGGQRGGAARRECGASAPLRLPRVSAADAAARATLALRAALRQRRPTREPDRDDQHPGAEQGVGVEVLAEQQRGEAGGRDDGGRGGEAGLDGGGEAEAEVQQELAGDRGEDDDQQDQHQLRR